MSRTWTFTTPAEYDALKGMDVFTSDDAKIGKVDEVLHPANNSMAPDQHYFLVKPGKRDKLIRDDELYVPATAVQMVGQHRVVLETSSDIVQSVKWTPPRDVDTFRRR
jgi:hypothetical protein